MDKFRMLFSKTGRAIYISHLDLMRTIPRAFMRADCRLKYSEGFNPRPQISIAMPLPVCCASLCEIMDFKMLEPIEPGELKARLEAQMPEGIDVLDIYEPTRKPKEIKWLRILGILEYDERTGESMVPELERFFSSDSIVIEKRTKRGMGSMDIKPAIKEMSFEPFEDGVKLRAVISAQEPTLNPELLASALTQLEPDTAPDFAKFERVEIYDEQMNVFR